MFCDYINTPINEDGLFPLALSVIYGYKIIAQLIAKNRYSMANQKDNKGWNVLHFAARYDRLEILDLFIRDPKFNFVEYGPDKRGN